MATTVRQYVVASRLDGELPDGMEPYSSEEEAIAAFRSVVSEAARESLHMKLIDAGQQVRIHQELDALSIGLLLGLSVGDKLSCKVGEYTYYIRLVNHRNIPDQVKVTTPPPTLRERRKALEVQLVEAIEAADIEGARRIMEEIDKLPYLMHARQARIEVIVGMIQYIRDNWLLPPDQLSADEMSHRAGYLHAILVAAGIPYAVAGEMRPSGIWQSTFQTVKIIALDATSDAREAAEWLIDLDRPEPAPDGQDDFAGQPCTPVEIESFATGNRQGNEGIDYDRSDTEN